MDLHLCTYEHFVRSTLFTASTLLCINFIMLRADWRVSKSPGEAFVRIKNQGNMILLIRVLICYTFRFRLSNLCFQVSNYDCAVVGCIISDILDVLMHARSGWMDRLLILCF